MEASLSGANAEVAGQWFDSCHRAGIPLGAATEMAERLVAAYGEPHRRYHTLDHVGACLRLVAHASIDPDDRLAVEFAIWFHDVVYDPRRSDNEEQSAALAESWLEAHGLPSAAIIGNAIRMTAGHRVDPDHPIVVQVVHDVDLAILGAPDDDYDRYVTQIRGEYDWLDDETFERGRRHVLEAFLEADPLYVLEPLRDALEAQARANISRELASLT